MPVGNFSASFWRSVESCGLFLLFSCWVVEGAANAAGTDIATGNIEPPPSLHKNVEGLTITIIIMRASSKPSQGAPVNPGKETNSYNIQNHNHSRVAKG